MEIKFIDRKLVVIGNMHTNKTECLCAITNETHNFMDKLIRPVFTLEVNHKIVPGLITVGKYDGSHPCITAATTADKVKVKYKYFSMSILYY